jgi:glycosyltransferase involved in cell wall biosynthesis
MMYVHWIAGALLALAWWSRLLSAARGMPHVTDVAKPGWNRNPVTAAGDPSVSIIVPARDEADTIGEALTRLLALDYENYEVIAVNDRSRDQTGVIMDQVSESPAATGRLTVIHLDALPAGWLGKTHAMWTAARQARGEWLLFTDGDVLFKPDALRRTMAYAESESADHVVLFPRMIMHGAGEKMMIAFFQTLFVFGHRPWKVADPRTKDHMGVGAFNLVRRRVYEAVGTYQRLKLEVLDDMKLGKVVKEAGFAQRNVFGEDLISVRWGRGALGIVNNLTKNFFALVSFQWPRAIASVVALLFLNLWPFLGVWQAHGVPRLLYGAALLAMFLIYFGMSRRSNVAPYYFLLHPLSTVLFAYTLMRSTWVTLGNGGVQWRGTFYPLEELRRGMV